MRELPEVQAIEACGSLRRKKETIGDIDLLASSRKPQFVIEHFLDLRWCTK